MTETPPDGLVTGEDNRARCNWATSAEDYINYHDDEWGRPVIDDRTLFEKMCLEGFQSGLSWITILRKREAFREVFANFDAATVATFGESEVLQLLNDARIIRHRGKIEATINNAHALLELQRTTGTLASLIWSFRPGDHSRPAKMADVPATTAESTALAKELKRCGFRFVGPTTAYAAMQAMGVVNDHMEGCWVGADCEKAQQKALRSVD